MLKPLIQDKRWWHPEDILLLILLGILFLLPGLYSIPLFDRDEPRFATAARTMMETGDYIVPHFNGALRPDKPPLVYWLMDLCYLVTGGPSESGARLPSVICSTLSLIVLYFMVGARFGRLTGFVAAMMFGTCTLFLVEARMATADATMLLTLVICMACAWRAWDAAPSRGSIPLGAHLPRSDYLLDRSAESSPHILDYTPQSSQRRVGFGTAMAFWISLAAGTLTKGVPLVFVFVPMVVLSLCTGTLPEQLRQWRSHFHLERWRTGTAVVIALCVVSYLVIGSAVPLSPDLRLWATILGLLLIGMILTPGLPGVLARCLWHGNWSWWRSLWPAVGIPLLIVLVGWWVIWAGIATHWQLIIDMVGNHFLNRAAGPLLNSLGIHLADTTTGGTQDTMRSYGKPPGFYLVTVWGTFFPWSILIIPAAYHTLRRLRGRTPIAIDPRPYQFLLAWILPMWIILELARGKLFHYPLPLFVPLAILCADTLVQSWNRMTDVLSATWFREMRWVMLIIWIAMGVGLLIAAKFAPDPTLMWKALPLAVGLIGTGFVSALTWGQPNWPYFIVLCWGGSLMVGNTMLLSDIPELRVSHIAADIMAEAKRKDPNLHLGVCGYEDATLVFYSDKNILRFNSPTDMINKVPFASTDSDKTSDPSANPYVIAVDEATRIELDHRHLSYTTLPGLDTPDNLQAFRISGFNVGNFKAITITVITNLPEPAKTSTAPATSTAASTPRPETAH